MAATGLSGRIRRRARCPRSSPRGSSRTSTSGGSAWRTTTPPSSRRPTAPAPRGTAVTAKQFMDQLRRSTACTLASTRVAAPSARYKGALGALHPEVEGLRGDRWLSPLRAVRVRHDRAGTLAPPTSSTGLFEVFRRRYLLRLLVGREISARYRGSVLGLLWSYVNPLTQFCIYYFVVGILFNLHSNVQNFAIHMFCGMVIVHFFNETFNAGTRSDRPQPLAGEEDGDAARDVPGRVDARLALPRDPADDHPRGGLPA